MEVNQFAFSNLSVKTGEEKGDFFLIFIFLKQYISAGMGGKLSENLNLLVMQRESWQLEKGRGEKE